MLPGPDPELHHDMQGSVQLQSHAGGGERGGSEGPNPEQAHSWGLILSLIMACKGSIPLGGIIGGGGGEVLLLGPDPEQAHPWNIPGGPILCFIMACKGFIPLGGIPGGGGGCALLLGPDPGRQEVCLPLGGWQAVGPDPGQAGRHGVYSHVSVVDEGPPAGPLEDVVEEVLEAAVEGVALGGLP